MKQLRLAWVFLNVAIGTAVMASSIILVSPVDRSKRLIGHLLRYWARWLLWSMALPITVSGRDNLPTGKQVIYMCNHSSALDIPLALANLPGTVVFMAKQELFRIVLFGWGLRAAGYIPVDRSNSAKARLSVERALHTLQTKPVSLMLFPEGTRTEDGKLLPFKKGVFHLALRTRLPLVPVAIQGSFEALPPNSISLTRTPIKVRIGQLIKTEVLTEEDRESLIKNARDRIQELLDSP